MHLLKRAGIFLAGDAAARGIGFLVLVAAARVLGPLHFGQFAAVYAVIAIALLLSDFGLTPLVLRTLSRRGFRARIFWSGLAVNVLSSALLYATLVLAASAVGAPYLVTCALYGPVLVVQAFASSFDAILLSSERSSRLAGIRLMGNALLGAAACAALVIHPTVAALSVAFLLANVAKGALSFFSVASLLGRPRASSRVAKVMFMRALPFAWAAIFSFLYFRLDTVLVAWLAGASAAGVYSGGYRFLDALLLVPGALAYVAFPAWMKKVPSAVAVSKLLSLAAFAGGFLALVLAAVAGPLVALTLGDGYRASSVVLRILLLGLPILYVDVLLVWLAYAHHRERAVVVVGAVALAANIGLNLVFVPRFGTKGAAAVTVLSESVNLLGYAAVFWHGLRLHAREARRATAAFAASVAPAALILEAGDYLRLSSVLALLIGVATFTALGSWTGLVRYRDFTARGRAELNRVSEAAC